MKARIPKPEPTEEQKAKAIRENEKSNRSYLNYAHRRLMISAHENFGFGGERLKRFSYNTYDVGEEALAKNEVAPLLSSVEELMAGADPRFGEVDFFETAANTYYALRGELLAFGFDPEKSLWVFHDPYGMGDFPWTWYDSASEREKKEAYLEFVNKMSQLCLTLLCMAAKELHQTEGFGAGRLDKVMRPVGESWDRLMRLYLTMDADVVQREKKAVRDAFNRMGCFTEEYAV